MSQEATIRRGVRNARYAAIPNHVFEDARLSMEARWLLGYLLSKPDNWTVVIGDIIKKGSCGRDKARKMIAELVEFGYAEREQQRDDGKFGSSVLVIFDEPRNMPENLASGGSVAFLPQTEMPAPVMPSPVSPAPVKSAHSNNLDSANTDCKNLREGVREAEGQEDASDRRKIEDAFWRVVKGWPDSAGMPKDQWKREWFALTPDERAEAARLRDAWLAMIGKKRQHIPVPGTYFREKLWLDVPLPEELARPANVVAPPYGKLWNSTRIADLLLPPTGVVAGPTGFEQAQISAGKTTLADVMAEKRMRSGWPTVNLMHERARDRQGWLCPLSIEDAAKGFEQVHRDSERMEAWRREHKRRGWPFFDGRLPDWIYFPAIDAGEDLDRAVAEAVDRYREQISDYLAARSKGDDHAA
ncbi:MULTISPECIES: hypothetical protein [unclassified Ensifer]|uniref:hypothetical protein n=1 Tax=unclassified Ensifer TaxID=2633371 RepID=UPI00070CAA18|nr:MULTISPECIES: hypothetical protein [unclassified Ensifer]KQW62873.1 hypothetical protein ASD02_01765 [Ensifer sp. Root1252]KRC83694.1 hypothetical protein ASE32_01755 [Ensifer sp. Root231]KRD04047.1 hypothetical protein ASE47_00415 [Ensifer sp. Root258]